MARLKAFILGAIEFRSDFTTSYDEWELMNCYDAGREFAHRMTFRKWES